jgi:hypothetical protein
MIARKRMLFLHGGIRLRLCRHVRKTDVCTLTMLPYAWPLLEQMLRNSGAIVRSWTCLEIFGMAAEVSECDEGSNKRAQAVQPGVDQPSMVQLGNPVGVVCSSSGEILVSDSEHCSIFSIFSLSS